MACRIKARVVRKRRGGKKDGTPVKDEERKGDRQWLLSVVSCLSHARNGDEWNRSCLCAARVCATAAQDSGLTQP